MNFGLNLVLSLTDRASAGMERATSTLNQLTTTVENAAGQLNEMASLTAFSAIADRVGSGMMSVGSTILSTFSQVINKVNETGRTLMYAENQLGKLYEGSGKTGKEVIGQISDYAKKSIFEFEDLIPVVTMLKANGIEAFDSISSSTGNANQTLMDYAADLAAFNPQMRNAYGTGIRAAMGALSEYIAEGNAMSLKRGASLDITALLGEDKGKTIEERSRQVADLLEKLNMVGMTAQMANSPITKLSNMQDTLFQFKGMLSDSGIYDEINNIIDIFSQFVKSLGDERLQNIANTIGGALTSLIQPLEGVATKVVELADSFLTFVEQNPDTVASIVKIVGAFGAVLVAGGAMLKMMGSLGKLSMFLKQLSPSITSISSAFKLGGKSVLKFGLALGALYLLWKTDFLGIKTMLTEFVTNVSTAFKTSDDAISGDVNHMKEVLQGLDRTTFWGNITYGLTQVRELISLVGESWDNYTLSEDSYQKAQELGIIGLVESFLDLKYKFDAFKEGFIAGWNEIKDKVKKAIDGITEGFKGTFIGDALDKLKGFLDNLSGGDRDSWVNAGNITSKVVTGLIGLWGATKLFKGVNRIVGSNGIIGTILGGKNKNNPLSSSDSGSIFTNPKKAAKTLASISILLGGFTLLVTALGAIMSIPGLSDYMTNGASTITQLFSVLETMFNPKALAVIGATALLGNVPVSTAAKGMANMAIIIGGFEALILAFGALSTIEGLDTFQNGGGELISKLFTQLNELATPENLAIIGGTTAFGLVSPALPAKGIANIAEIVAGFEAIILAFGALNQIEGISEFQNGGCEQLSSLFTQIGSLATADNLSIIGVTTAFGLVSPALPAKGIANIAEIAGGLEALILAFGALKSIEGLDAFQDGGGELLSKTFSQIAQLGTVENGGIVAAVAVLGLIPPTISASGIANIGIITGGLEAIILAFGAINKIPGINEFQSGGGELLKTVFTQVGTACGGLISGFTAEVTSGLPEIGTKIGDFATNAKPFFEQVDTMANADNLGKFADGFAKLVGAFTLDKISSFVTGETNYADMGAQLSQFAITAMPFFALIKGVSDQAFTNTDKLFTSLSNLAGYQFKEGGLLQKITGEVDIGGIGTQLNEFAAGALGDGTNDGFFNMIKDVPDESFDKTKKLFEALGGIGDYDFKSGGLAQLITGTTNFGSIGGQLNTFVSSAMNGDDGVNFFDSVLDIDDNAFTKMKSLFEALQGIGNYDFKTGGLAQLITGNTNFGSIGGQLNSFVSSAMNGDSNFFSSILTIDDSAFDKMKKLFEALQGIGDYDFKTGGLAQLITGTTNFGSIGTQLATFINGAMNGDTNFFTALDSVSEKSLTNMGTLFTALSAIGNSNFKDGGLVQWITGETNLGTLGEQLSQFITNADTFLSSSEKYNSDDKFKGVSNILSIFTALSEHADQIQTIKNTNVGWIGDHLKTFIKKIDEGMKDVGGDRVTDILSFANNLGIMSGSLAKLIEVSSSIPTTDASSTGISTFLTNLANGINEFSVTLNTEGFDISGVTSSITTLSSSFATLSSDISTYMSDMVSTVSSSLSSMSESFSSTSFSFNHSISLPHFSLSGSFDAETGSVPVASVSWYGKGGIFDSPSLIGVGEAGKEAVLPLENNTEWISMLSDRLVENLIPSNQFTRNTSPTDFMGSNSNSTVYEGSTDNSVVFNEGAIQITCKNASEEEALNLAKKIMKYIERQQQLKAMANYGV